MEQKAAYKIMDFPLEERPRERLIKYNAQSLSNAELLAIILGKGTKKKNVLDLSREIFSQYNLSQLSSESIVNLCKINGIGTAKACQIVACFELGRRQSSYTDKVKPQIKCAEDVYFLIKPHLKNQKKEHFIALFLDTRKRLIRHETLFIGTLDTSVLHPREIFKAAIKESAAALIIAHNHPSGDTEPSNEDIEITKQLIKAGKVIGIQLLDHIIIGDNAYTSLRENKELIPVFE